MKRYFILTIGLLFFIIGITSCKKYLEKKPDKALVVLNKLEDCQALLDYNSNINQYQNNGIGEVSSDNYYLLDADLSSLFFQSDKSLYVWGDEIFYDNPPGNNDWSNIYGIVYKANVVLEALEKIGISSENEQEWNNVKGSALFFRGWAFHILATNHSKTYDKSSSSTDLGIPLRLKSDFNETSTRSSVETTYLQILNDLEASISLLPEFPYHTMRPSKTAAYGLLSRVYLSMLDYENSRIYADSCLQLNSSLMDYSSLNSSLNFPIPVFNSEVIFHAIGANNPTYYGKVDSILIQSYSPDDLRKSIFFKDNGDSSFSWKCSYDGTNFNLFVGLATDEIYLTMAECLAREGNYVEGLNLLNALMIKRWQPGSFIPFTAPSQYDAIDIIVSERRKELVWRDLRWMDIKRLNKEGANISLKRVLNGQTFTLLPNDNKFALPLPASIIQLTGMQQNPR